MKNIETINADNIKDVFSSHQRPENHINEHFILVRQSDFIMNSSLIGQPMRLTELRFLRVLSGQAKYRINLLDHYLKTGDMLMLPPDTLLEVESISDEYRVEVFAVIDFPGIHHEIVKKNISAEVIHLALSATDRERMDSYFLLLSQQMKNYVSDNVAISHLALSMTADLVNIQRNHSLKESPSKHSRGEYIMFRFIALLRQYGTTVRNIPFYSDQLALSPNHLSAVVRQQSGLSVMDWLNRTTLTEAKVLLKHSDYMIYEIANRLAFPEPTAFNRYFKKHIGITPKEYRNG